MPLEYSAPWKRGAALFVDLAVVAPLGWWVGQEHLFGIFVLYNAALEASRWQRTPGKWMIGAKTMEKDGRKVGLVRAAGRSVLKCVNLPALAFPWWGAEWKIWAVSMILLAATCATLLLDRRHRTWYDRICGTSVISPPSSEVKPVGRTPDRT